MKITWADPARGNFMPHLLNQDLEELEVDDTAKLAFELVATRAIQKGEEVFLDYGDAWEQAWQAHVQAWEPEPDSINYVSQEEIDRQLWEEPWRTVFEQIDNPYPPHIMLQCHSFFQNVELLSSMSYEKILQKFQRKLEGNRSDDWFECDVLRRYTGQDGTPHFAVVSAEEHEDDTTELLTNLPASAIRFRERPYTSDMFLKNAFRHEIGIPNEMFPDSWRNVENDL